MNKKELNTWYRYIKAIKNNTYLEKEDKREFMRLNHLVMEASHAIHNANMLNVLW